MLPLMSGPVAVGRVAGHDRVPQRQRAAIVVDSAAGPVGGVAGDGGVTERSARRRRFRCPRRSRRRCWRRWTRRSTSACPLLSMAPPAVSAVLLERVLLLIVTVLPALLLMAAAILGDVARHGGVGQRQGAGVVINGAAGSGSGVAGKGDVAQRCCCRIVLDGAAGTGSEVAGEESAIDRQRAGKALSMAPPELEALLSEKVVLARFSVPLFAMPPPMSAELLRKSRVAHDQCAAVVDRAAGSWSHRSRRGSCC